MSPFPCCRKDSYLEADLCQRPGGIASPPKHYTEDSFWRLWSAGAEDMPEDAEGAKVRHPGHPCGYFGETGLCRICVAEEKAAYPTEKGTNLILVLPDNIKSPMLTAEWESILKQVERGEVPAKDFMDGIADMSRALVKAHTAPEECFAGLFPDAKKNGREAVGTCPLQGEPYEGKKGVFLRQPKLFFPLER